MGLNLNTSQQLAVLVAVILVGVIYTLRQIPHKFQQREEGERIIGRKAFREATDVKAEFSSYFNRIFRSLVFLAISFFAVNVLMALAVNAFITSYPGDQVFSSDSAWPWLSWPPLAVSIVFSLMMCSACWVMIVSLFYNNRAAKLGLETKYDDFFRE